MQSVIYTQSLLDTGTNLDLVTSFDRRNGGLSQQAPASWLSTTAVRFANDDRGAGLRAGE